MVYKYLQNKNNDITINQHAVFNLFKSILIKRSAKWYTTLLEKWMQRKPRKKEMVQESQKINA